MLLKNCYLVREDFQGKVDIRIEGEKVKEIGEWLKPKDREEVIDIEGKLVTPGGIDLHVHLALPVAETVSCDDFYTGTKAALAGGTTTVVDFVHPERGESIVDAIEKRLKEVKEPCCDYSFHIAIVEVNERVERELDGIKGFHSIKLYTGYLKTVGLNFRELERAFELASKNNLIIHLHAELGEKVEARLNRFVKEGKNSPKFHPLLRPSEEEGEAVKKAIELAIKYNTELYIVHISCEDALKEVKKGKERYDRLYGETCPHYLYLDRSLYELEDRVAVRYVLSPPLRRAKDRDSLWNGIKEGTIDTIATDHCPFTIEQKINGLRKNNLGLIPGGGPGIQERFPIVLTEALNDKISLERAVELCCSNPSKIMRRYPKKGTVKVGSDADIVVWERVKPETTFKKVKLITKANYTLYPDFKVKVLPERVFLRGVEVYHKGEFYNEGRGKFLKG